MKYAALAAIVAASTSTPAIASPALAICQKPYALCASSPTVAIPGETVKVNGKTFPAGVSVCPVLRGPSIADLSLMNGSCSSPDGTAKTVWSLFSNVQSYPQLPDWAVLPSVKRTFTTTAAPGGGMSNMWSFPCVVRPRKVNGVRLADCRGPMNESPWTGDAVPFGATVGTAAPLGLPNPVGGNFP
jgi:hypothetical protein